VQRALGIEESQEAAEKRSLKEELDKSLQAASLETMRRALDALSKANKG
jgi:hypothetical protein